MNAQPLAWNNAVDQVYRAFVYAADRGWHGHTVVVGDHVVSTPGQDTRALAERVADEAPCVVRWTHLDGNKAWTRLHPQGDADWTLVVEASRGIGPLDGFGEKGGS